MHMWISQEIFEAAMKLTGNTILVTGATAGIGLALTEECLKLGNKVIGIGRNQDALRGLSQQHQQFVPLPCDLTKQDEFDFAINFIRQNYPDLNIIVNNAGIQFNYDVTVEPVDGEKAKEEIQLNLTTPIKIVYGLLLMLLPKKESAIVNVTTGLALAPKKSAPVYCAAKAGLRTFTRTLRYQLAHTTVKVFEVIPPLVDTNMTKGRGNNKITALQVAGEIISGLEHNRYEIPIGKVKLLIWIMRVFPSIGYRIMKNN